MAAYSYDGDKMAYSTAPLRITELARSRGWEMAGDETFVCDYEPNRVRMMVASLHLLA